MCLKSCLVCPTSCMLPVLPCSGCHLLSTLTSVMHARLFCSGYKVFLACMGMGWHVALRL
jgi:hypothetical protein